MKLTIDNLDGSGARDCTQLVNTRENPNLVRKLNCVSEFKFGLLPGTPLPTVGARVALELNNGKSLFTGYVAQNPTCRYVGEAERGSVYCHDVVALSDAMLLDQKAPPPHPPFVARTSGDAFRQLTEDALPGWFDCSGVDAEDPLPYYSVDPAKKWSASAAEIALAARGVFRDDAGKLRFARLAENTYALAESDPAFSPRDLHLQSVNRVVNDLTILGEPEPSAHVKDYFIGDGYTTKFYLSQQPFTRSNQIQLYNRTILDESYADLDPAHWTVADPQHAFSVSNGQLQVAGGTGIDGQTVLSFIERIELGGATVIEHGDVVFNAASDGVIGGLYAGTVSIPGCLAGFRITPAGGNSSIQALVQGALAGASLMTQPGHHYVFTTQLYPTEVYRMRQVFHSSGHPAGSARGGEPVGCDVRVVLQVHDIDPSDPASQIAEAAVLYDGVISNAPGFCKYALVNAKNLRCSIAFTYIWLPLDALVRSTPYQGSTVTVRTGSLRDGAACHVSTEPALQFYPEYIPAANEAIAVSYRGQGHAMARIIDGVSIAAHQRGGDDGVRGSVRQIGLPVPRTSADCETAALALLDEAGQGWAGQYEAWSRFLPGSAADIFPGDGLSVNAPSRCAGFLAVVREVAMQIVDIGGDNSRYTLHFVDAGDPSLGFTFVSALMKQTNILTPIDVTGVGDTYLADLTEAQVTGVTSTTITIDTGVTPSGGGGIEVRYSDAGWGIGNTRNLIGRFSTQTFALTRYARSQDYFLRSYDSSTPPKYSRYSTALHVNYPL